MNFQDLHELLRLELLRRIEQGDLTGTRLAQQTQFRQGHISNFLNRKRALSLEGLDRVLAAQELAIEQILPVSLSAGAHGPVAAGEAQAVPVVSASAAAEEERIHAASVIEMLQFPTSRLDGNLARPSSRRAGWQRFVAVRPDAQQAAAMEPVIVAGSVAVIDRHYTSLAPYRAHQATLYAVRYGRGLLLRYVEFDDNRLILRPTAMECPVQLIAIGANEMPADYIVGRVCLVLNEF